jgi:anion-transporting  ArsA/GET3 family ATPase
LFRDASQTEFIIATIPTLLTLLTLTLTFITPPPPHTHTHEQLRIREVKSLFRDASQTEFIIATIPTQLGIAESRRLLATLQEETIPCKRIIINQVRPNGLGGGPLLGHTPNTPVPT